MQEENNLALALVMVMVVTSWWIGWRLLYIQVVWNVSWFEFNAKRSITLLLSLLSPTSQQASERESEFVLITQIKQTNLGRYQSNQSDHVYCLTFDSDWIVLPTLSLVRSLSCNFPSSTWTLNNPIARALNKMFSFVPCSLKEVYCSQATCF